METGDPRQSHYARKHGFVLLWQWCRSYLLAPQHPLPHGVNFGEFWRNNTVSSRRHLVKD